MYYERQIADEFWFFVRARAIDYRLEESLDQRHGTLTLNAREEHLTGVRQCLANSQGKVLPMLNIYSGAPWTYPTVQEALMAFLINELAHNAFPYSYEMWLRAVTLIVADAQRDPDWLHVIACDWEEGHGSEAPRTPHDMTISDDWSCLSRETFDFTVREYTRKG
ncbi:hypothetical protein [Amycolatopsis sp. lyj-23]|uniref:hypothetical protein n=1 Tax=Amycolatopsis sp. lyj-23 TaxID=2789283 RepID=UPI00397BABBA